MKDHIWIADKIKIIWMCAVCGMERQEWKKTGKPQCKEKLPIPEDYNYGYA